MINQSENSNISYILSNAAQVAYEKIKALIRKIFSLLAKDAEQKDLKEEFYRSYIDFARKLDEEGHEKESNSYMSICDMYYDLMNRPEELMAHQSFFMDLFNAFDTLLMIKINDPENYDEAYDQYLRYKGEMQEYYYTKVAVPSPFYDKKVCKRIIGNLAGDLDE